MLILHQQFTLSIDLPVRIYGFLFYATLCIIIQFTFVFMSKLYIIQSTRITFFLASFLLLWISLFIEHLFLFLSSGVRFLFCLLYLTLDRPFPQGALTLHREQGVQNPVPFVFQYLYFNTCPILFVYMNTYLEY